MRTGWCAAALLLSLELPIAACTPAQGNPQVDASTGAAPQPAAPPDAGDAAAKVQFTGVVSPQDAGSPDEAIPPSTPGELTTRGKHLLEALAHDTPDLATDIVFPRDAWSLSRDSADPSKLWDKKITGAFQKDIHTLHKRIKMADKAQFVSFEIGHAVTQITPKKKEWKKPLWKVRHSKLSFTIEGKAQRIEIDEMTSWRGAWYITKLR